MATITNHTRQALVYPAKGGGTIEVPARGTAEGDLDKGSALVKGALHAGAITLGRGETPPPEPVAPETKKQRAAKPD